MLKGKRALWQNHSQKAQSAKSRSYAGTDLSAALHALSHRAVNDVSSVGGRRNPTLQGVLSYSGTF